MTSIETSPVTTSPGDAPSHSSTAEPPSSTGDRLSPEARALCSGPSTYIDGRWVEGDGVAFDTTDPSTGRVLGTIAASTVAQTDAAIASSRRAFDGGRWATLDGNARGDLIQRLVEGLDAHRDELIELVIAEVGSPLQLAQSLQVATPIENFTWFIDAARRGPRDGLEEALPLHHTPVTTAGALLREPVGVISAYSAYNYPFNLLAWKIGGALASGCATVLLPSPRATLCTIAFMKIVDEAGFPPGALNMVVGGPEVGEALATSPSVDMISFTGSPQIGGHVMALGAPTIKKVVLELGGKSPNIVLPSADPDPTVAPSILRFCRNAGQGCGATTRTFVHRDSYDRYAEAMAAGMAALKVGDPRGSDIDVGPLISAEHRDRVQAYVDRAVSDGATVLTGGGRPDGLAEGFYFEPTLIGGVSNDAEIAQEELFGPVGVIQPYDDVDHVVQLANDTRFGLNANVWGRTTEAMDVARRLRSGTVTINGGGGMRPDVPWGGYGQSGVGREMGEEGFREFFEVKHVQWPVDGQP